MVELRNGARVVAGPEVTTMHYAMILGMTLACGCAATTQEPADAGALRPSPVDAALAADADADSAVGRPVPTGELQVRRAWWSGARALSLVVILRTDARLPVPAWPSTFTLETTAGSHPPVGSDDPAACAGGAVVAPGERLRCVLRFEPAGAPLRLRHAPTGAVGEVAGCSPIRRDGLCPLDRACVDGACAPLCGPSRWDGICLDDQTICSRGACAPPCSPDDPHGACGEGRCVNGACRTDCATIAWPDDACFACAWDAIELGRCDPGPDRCRDCIDCPGEPQGEPERYRYPTTCECLERASCDGCRDEARSFWSCLLDRCPACAE